MTTKYDCNPCNFHSDDKTNYEIHLMTDKHKIINNIEYNKPKNYRCDPCIFILTTSPLIFNVS